MEGECYCEWKKKVKCVDSSGWRYGPLWPTCVFWARHWTLLSLGTETISIAGITVCNAFQFWPFSGPSPLYFNTVTVSQVLVSWDCFIFQDTAPICIPYIHNKGFRKVNLQKSRTGYFSSHLCRKKKARPCGLLWFYATSGISFFLSLLSFLFVWNYTVRNIPSLHSSALRQDYWHSAELAKIIMMVVMMTLVRVSA